MTQVKAPQPSPSANMKMKTEDIAFGVMALIAIAALVLYMR